MKKIFAILLGVGFSVIVVLGGYVGYRVIKIQNQAQKTLNQMLENYNQDGIKMEFEPFKCGGFLLVECKSARVDAWENGELLFSLQNPILRFKDFDSKGLVIEYQSGFDYAQKMGLDAYFEVLMPKVLKFSSHLSLQSQESILAQSKLHFEAQNIAYDVDFDSRILSPSLKGKGFFAYLMNPKLEQEVIFLKNAQLQLQANGLNQALFEAVKKQYGDLNYAGYQGIVALMMGLSVKQFPDSSLMQKMIFSLQELILGQKTKMIAQFKPDQEICLTCENFILEGLLQDSNIDIATF